jgi:hypothetical protein
MVWWSPGQLGEGKTPPQQQRSIYFPKDIEGAVVQKGEFLCQKVGKQPSTAEMNCVKPILLAKNSVKTLIFQQFSQGHNMVLANNIEATSLYLFIFSLFKFN